LGYRGDRHGVWNVVDGLNASLVRVKPWWRTHRCQRFTAALDGKTGRDQQQSNGGEVTDINAVRRSERHQDRYFWEGFNNHKPDSYGGQREGLEPAAALARSRHLQRVTTWS
jgi:hypothetical protein